MNTSIVVIPNGETSYGIGSVFESETKPNQVICFTDKDEEVISKNYEGVDLDIIKKIENINIAQCMNFAIQNLKPNTEIVGFVDCDGSYEPEKIKQSVEIFENHPEVIAVTSDYYIHMKNGITIMCTTKPFKLSNINSYEDNNIFVRIGVIKNKTIFNHKENNNPFGELMSRLCKVGLVYNIPVALHHRIYEN